MRATIDTLFSCVCLNSRVSYFRLSVQLYATNGMQQFASVHDDLYCQWQGHFTCAVSMKHDLTETLSMGSQFQCSLWVFADWNVTTCVTRRFHWNVVSDIVIALKYCEWHCDCTQTVWVTWWLHSNNVIDMVTALKHWVAWWSWKFVNDAWWLHWKLFFMTR